MSSIALYPLHKSPTTHPQKLLTLNQKQKYLLNSRIQAYSPSYPSYPSYPSFPSPQSPSSRYISHLNSPLYSKSETKQRRFIQQSTFLPSISSNRKESIQRLNWKRNSYGDVWGGDAAGTLETDTQVNLYIGECQVLIENLKRLAGVNKGKADRQFFKESKPNSLQHRYQNNYEQSSRKPNFFMSHQQPYESPNKSTRKSTLKKYSNIFNYTNGKPNPNLNPHPNSPSPKKSHPHQKYSLNEDDDNEFQSRVKANSNNSEIWEEGEQSNTENLELGSSRKRMFVGRGGEEISQIKETGRKSQGNGLGIQEEDQRGSGEDQEKGKSEKEQRQWQQLLKKQQQQLQKAQRRHKFLLKSLNKAKTRGFELHKKITLHRLKNNSSLTTTKQNQQNKKDTKDIAVQYDQKDQESHDEKDKEKDEKKDNESEEGDLQEENEDGEKQGKKDQKEEQNEEGEGNAKQNPENQGIIPTEDIVLKLIEQNS